VNDRFSIAEGMVTSIELYAMQVAPGDAMIIASDGLFDNLFDEEIAEIVNALVRVRNSVSY
jgi:serine/threonine protein phosphatase PrpC